MKVTHHLDDATVLAYAAATLPAALQVVAASHIAWCKCCRERVRIAEAAGGQELEQLPISEVSEACRDMLFTRLDEVDILERHEDEEPTDCNGLPEPLAKLIGHKSLDELKWRRVVPGVHFYDIPMDHAQDGQLRMMKISAGKMMPEHGHGGDELTLVLRGAYRDDIGTFGIGDIADLDQSVAHTPVVTQDGECICLVATEAKTRFKSFTARLLQPIVGI